MLRTFRALALAAVVAVVPAAGLTTPAAAARPSPTPVVVHVAEGNAYAMAAGLGAVWAARTDELHSVIVYRIDVGTGRATRVRELDLPGASLAVGFGSLWVTDYYGNAVYRLSPRGVTQARVATGLQPQAIHLAFGSVWVANHHGHSVTRIDPRTDQVVATVSAGDPSGFRAGPQDMTDHGQRLYVGSSNLPSLQWVDPRTDTTTSSTTTSDDAFCGPLVWLAEHVWSQDNCTNTLYEFTPDGTLTTSIPGGSTPGASTPAVLGAVPFRGQLWDVADRTFDPDTLTGSDATVQRRDLQTGAIVESIPVGGDASSGLFAGFGSLWVPDPHAGIIRRVTPTR